MTDYLSITIGRPVVRQKQKRLGKTKVMHRKKYEEIYLCKNNRGVGAKSTTSLCSPAAVCTLGSKVPETS